MKRYYLIKVNAAFCPSLFVSPKAFHILLDVCATKGILVNVFSSVHLPTNPDLGLRNFKEVFNVISNLPDIL